MKKGEKGILDLGDNFSNGIKVRNSMKFKGRELYKDYWNI